MFELSPCHLIDTLHAGNARHVCSRARYAATDEHADLEETRPLALVLACSDLGIPPSSLFDVRPGELLVPQSAAITVDDGVLATVAFAHEFHGIDLVIVLGHSPCRVFRACAGQACGALSREVDTSLRQSRRATPPEKVHTARMAALLRTKIAGLGPIHVASAHVDETSRWVEFL